ALWVDRRERHCGRITYFVSSRSVERFPESFDGIGRHSVLLPPGFHRGKRPACGAMHYDDGMPPATGARSDATQAFADLRVGAHRLRLLRDGSQAFPAMLDAIAAARSNVCLETYILRDDGTGRRFAEALIGRARAGVQVNLIYDAWGSSVSEAFLSKL